MLGRNLPSCLLLGLRAAQYSGQEAADNWTPGLTRCVQETFHFHCGCQRDTSKWIVEHRNPWIQGPVTIAASNLGVLIPTLRMHTKAIASSISHSLQTFCWCFRSRCCLWQCFGWGLSLKNISPSSPKTSATDRCSLPPWSVIRLVRLETLLPSQPSRRGERCREVKLAFFFFLFYLRVSLRFLTATRPQDNRGVILVTHHKSSSNIMPPAKMTLKWAIMTTLFFLPPSYPSS